MGQGGGAMRKDRIDAAGALGLGGLAFLFATNQIAISIAVEGFAPAFAAALRSVLAAGVVALWLGLRGRPLGLGWGDAGRGLALGAAFAAEFLCLFHALDLTTVPRATIMLYSMPVWLAIGAHLLLPGERITPTRAAGLGLAFAGMALALAGNADSAAGDLRGDLLAVCAALGWAGLTLMARFAGARGMGPETQLLWMLIGSAPVMAAAAAFEGAALRAPDLGSVLALLHQSVIVAAAGFLMWFRLLARYPASSVAAAGLLTPVLAIALGWAVLGDPVGPGLILAGALVIGGLVLVNRTGAPGTARR